MARAKIGIQIEQELHDKAKVFCIQKGISLTEFYEAAVLNVFLDQGYSKVVGPPCKHDEDLCWGTCGSDPKKLWMKDNK